ncbi:MAG: PIG-L deacetylase family protein [Dehalogenimonas sp.]|jgi:LmbE family N-acetylglucosaminyl deacetylase|uniref:PIG-L deacetylase family protein n=1 Tax=Candidatus Dehalogenimonas loeffleri TaxID=3127115 RepID=A0ABZ2J1R9_9CHLR|nr:PIG-L deacetylase family protein [Dehalogenimonas sp.]
MDSVKQADVLVVMAHPDDPEFSSGGTIARLAGEGKRVVYVICTAGDKGTDDRQMPPARLVAIRMEEQRAAARTLGVEDVVFLGNPDQGLEATPELRKELVRLIRLYRPELVITHSPYQRYIWWHRDHRQCGEATMDAVFPYSRDHLAYPDLLAAGYEPHKVGEVWLAGAEDSDYRSDIEGFFDRKVEAIKCHRSQVGDDFAARLDRIKARASAAAEGEEFLLAESFKKIEIPW